jgi:peptide/nickel transport system permease protein
MKEQRTTTGRALPMMGWVPLLALALPTILATPALLDLPAALSQPASLASRLAGPGLAGLTWLLSAVLLALAIPRAAALHRAPPGRGQRSPWQGWARHPGLMVGAGLVVLLVQCALLAPLLAPHDPNLLHAAPSLSAPSPACWMGSDLQGRDLLSRTLWGGRVSMAVGGLSVGLSLTLGCTLGALAGWYRGWVERAVLGVADLFLAMPRLVLVLAVMGLLRLPDSAGLVVMVVVLGMTGWMTMARMVRAGVRAQARGALAQTCTVLGLPTWRVLLIHLLPGNLGPVLVHATLNLGRVVLIEASLSFLGLGVPQPIPSWGATVAEGRSWLPDAWWLSAFPGLALVTLVIGLELLGAGLQQRLVGAHRAGQLDR